MYYYAFIDPDTSICLDVVESESPIEDAYWVQLDDFHKDYIYRKRYDNGQWIDTTAEEAASLAYKGEHVAIFNEWLDVVLDGKAPLEHTHTGYATSNHIHTGYVSSDDLQVLVDTIDTKADSTHTHSEYANVNHSHSDYATQTALDTLSEEVEGKADIGHSHTEYALSAHEHNEYAEAGHNHNSDYSPLEHSHTNYATTTSLNELSNTVSGKANASHTHDDRYYTETEIDSKLATKADSSHNHTGVYDVNGAAASALTSANAYTDSKIDALVGEGASTTLDTIGEISAAIEDNQDAIDLLNSAIANKANVTDLNVHASDTELHITEAERNNWNAKSNFSGNYNDLTNKPTIPSISGLATETYVDTQISAIDIPDALSDLTTDSTHRVVTDAEKATWNAKSNFSGSYNDLTNKPSIPSISGLATETYVDEAVSTKANSSHTHTIANVTGLQNALDSKSDSTHNHNASYDALGAANSALTSAQTYTDEAIDALSETVSTKANASTLTSHTGNTTIHITGAERTNWNAAKTHADSAHAPTTNATQTASGLMSKADKIKLDGIVEGANNYTLPSAGTSLGGVKSGGDVTISGGVITVNDDSHNHVISNVDGLQSALDGKAASGHTHGDIYYTETEVDSLLSGKANSSHTHTIANITNLQSTLDGKAATSHGTHVSYSTTAPVMDGSASVGTASTVARSDHKHPTDTSRAAQTSLDSHTGNKSNPHGVTLAQLGVTATTAELNYVDGVTSAIQTQLNGKAASSHNHAATNITSGTLSSDRLPTVPISKGGTGATTAAAALTNLGITATSTELNYVDGVTSNVQTQLNNKMPKTPTSIELNQGGSLKGYGGFIDFHYYDADGNSSTNTDYSSRIIESGDGIVSVNDITFNRNGKIVTATTFNGATFSGSGVATVSEVETYLGI